MYFRLFSLSPYNYSIKLEEQIRLPFLVKVICLKLSDDVASELKEEFGSPQNQHWIHLGPDKLLSALDPAYLFPP